MKEAKGYKQTEVGLIPEDWEVKPLGEFLLRTPEYGINAAAANYSDILPTYIRITDISEDGKFLPEKRTSVNHPFSHKFYLEDGDIVFARTGASVGKTYLYNSNDGELVFAGFLIRVKPNSYKLIPQYLKSFTETNAYWSWVTVMSMRSGQPGVNGNEYSRLLIPLPPTLKEQQAIATALSETDSLISSLGKLIDKKKNIKQGVIQKLLAPKKDWMVKTYGEIFDFLTTATYSRAELRNGDEVSYVHYGDIHTSWTNFLDFSKALLPSIEAGKIKNYSFLQEGDLIMADASEDYLGVGKSVEIKNIKNRKAILGLHTFLLRDSKGVFVNGLKGYLHECSYIKKQFDKLATGMKVYGVSKNNLKLVEISIPSKTEQNRIVTILNDLDLDLELLEMKLNKYKMLKQGMMQNLLTGKVRLVCEAEF